MSRPGSPGRGGGAGADPWNDARVAAALLACDPDGLKGVHLRARAGPVRDRWLAHAASLFPDGAPRRRLPAGCDPTRLAGGIDVAATLSAGRPILDAGLLAAAHGGLLVAPMAERMERGQAAVICSALDRGAVRIERDGFSTDLPARFVLMALDEGAEPGETLLPALADRLGLVLDLSAVSSLPAEPDAADAGRVRSARRLLPSVGLDEAMLAALAEIASGVSPRRMLFLVAAARANAALRGAASVEPEDAAIAMRFVLGVDGIAEAIHQPPPSPPPGEDAGPERESPDGGPLADVVLEAAAALLPPGLLEAAAASRDRARGRSSGAGAPATSGRRGPAVGASPRPPFPGARPDVLATLRAAVPWQAIRRRDAASREAPQPGAAPFAGSGAVRVLASDFRYLRRREPQGTTIVFVVDASGSAAAARLAEAKGAVELLLAESYRRRDEVALVSFRGAGAEVVLPPTRSLVRAKRALASLPGGGGTPLADAILAAGTLADGIGRTGRQALTVFLTDGRCNIGLGGVPGRALAQEDAEKAALRFRSRSLRSIVVDTAARPQPALAALAGRLGADYQPLPRGDARGISQALAGRIAG